MHYSGEYYSKPSFTAGDTCLENSSFSKSALNDLNTVWEQWRYGNAAVESNGLQNHKCTVVIFIYEHTRTVSRNQGGWGGGGVW
jgi:hypothetical protein